tara:strand:+ start:499 stop:777 length:279 start_codon:yes stop_codon:yes gene_type:complete
MIEEVTLIVSGEPLFSAIEEAVEVKVIEGLLSSSVNVKLKLVGEPLLAFAPDNVPILTIIVSSLSDILSSVGVIVVEPVVAPAEMVILLIVA